MKILLLIFLIFITYNSVFCELLKIWGQPLDNLSSNVRDNSKMKSLRVHPTTDYEYPSVIYVNNQK